MRDKERGTREHKKRRRPETEIPEGRTYPYLQRYLLVRLVFLQATCTPDICFHARIIHLEDIIRFQGTTTVAMSTEEETSP
jgi:hypothetical protein